MHKRDRQNNHYKIAHHYKHGNGIAISQRNNKNIIILSNHRIANNQFLHMSSSFWNFFVKKLKIPNLNEIALSALKYKLTNYILINQNAGDPDQWAPYTEML